MFLHLLGERVLKPPPQEWLRASSGPGRSLDVFVRTTHLYAACSSFRIFVLFYGSKSSTFIHLRLLLPCPLLLLGHHEQFNMHRSRIANVARNWIKLHYEDDFAGGSKAVSAALSVRPFASALIPRSCVLFLHTCAVVSSTAA
jgi:hypothetical protein